MFNLFGPRRSHRGFFNHGPQYSARGGGASLGGLLLPIAGFLAWRNRDKLRGMFEQYRNQRTGNAPPVQSTPATSW